MFLYLVLSEESGVRGVRISLGSELDLKELLLDIVALPNLDKFETPVGFIKNNIYNRNMYMYNI